jgi:tellurite resistance protein
MNAAYDSPAETSSTRRNGTIARQIPLSFFGMPFGLAGLAGTWLTLAHYHQAPGLIGRVLLVLAGLVWVLVLFLFGRSVVQAPATLGTDLLDQVAGPFASMAVITPMLLAADGVYPYAPGAGRVLVDVFLAATVLLGGWFAGQWIFGRLEADHLHPGYFLPTVAGGLVGSACCAQIGQRRVAEAAFGLGAISWIVLSSVLLARLLFRPPLPASLTPTLAIEVAPPAVATLAYLAIDGDRIDAVAVFLGGFGLLMVLAQLRLLPVYARIKFTPSVWAFTFSGAVVASSAIHWIDDLTFAGQRVYAYLTATAVTLLVGGIATRTLVAVGHKQLIPGPAAWAAAPPRGGQPRRRYQADGSAISRGTRPASEDSRVGPRPQASLDHPPVRRMASRRLRDSSAARQTVTVAEISTPGVDASNRPALLHR